LCHSLSSHVANRASAVKHAFPDVSPISQMKSLAGELKLHGHLAPVFGLVCHYLGIESQLSQQMFLFTASRGILSSAVRLNVLGPNEAQAVLHE